MKKLLKNRIKSTTLFMLFALSFVVVSCSSDDDPAEPPVNTDPILLDCDYFLENRTLVDNPNAPVDYIVSCVASVRANLTIEPGVVIAFTPDSGLSFYETISSIHAVGTANKPIVFTGTQTTPGSWRGLAINSNNSANIMEYVTVSNGGGLAFDSNGDRGNIILYSDAALTLKNCNIINSQTYGLNAVYGGNDLLLENNTITNCDVPMRIRPNYVNAMVGGNYTGNGTDAIYLVDAALNIDAIYRDLGVPYHILSRLVVAAGGGKLTINPGVVMKFGLNGRLVIDEGASGSKPSLVAVGTAQNPILFTSIDPVLGAWQGIYFDTPSALNEIGFATIEYASNNAQVGAIYLWAYTVLNVHDVHFKDIIHCAIKLGSNGISLTTNNLSFENVGDEICIP